MRGACVSRLHDRVIRVREDTCGVGLLGGGLGTNVVCDYEDIIAFWVENCCCLPLISNLMKTNTAE